MARLRNTEGVTVVVSDDTAALLGPEWAPVEKPKPTPTTSKK